MWNRPDTHFGTAGHALVLTTVMAIAAAAASDPAEAVESAACRIEVLVDGRPLAEYPARGTTYIEALQEREYAVRLTNNLDRRIAVALAVDGLNTIDAKTTSAANASKWVLGPRETVTISGWQISATDARRFFFTTEERSYGTWLGRTADLGVIEAVVYREKLPRIVAVPDVSPAAPSGGFPSPAERSEPSTGARSKAAGESTVDDFAATGIGRRVDHRVQRVRLDLEDRPAARLRLRYEYRPQLVHLGVLPSPGEERALARRERASGFSDFEFAPDPFDRSR